MQRDQESQIQRLLEDINDAMLYDDEEAFNFFDMQNMLADLGVLASQNIGRELLEDKVEAFTAYLSASLGRTIHPEQSRNLLLSSHDSLDPGAP